jgi:uncharacterized protein (DUF1800 family)
MNTSKNQAFQWLFLLPLLLAGCGGPSSEGTDLAFVASAGQVQTNDSAPLNANVYAASRFLDQASWGPTTTEVQRVRQFGIEAWINQQLIQPASALNAPNYVIDYDNNNEAARQQAHEWFPRRFYDLTIGGSDQLRQRVSWALFNFIPVNSGAYPTVEYFNTFQRHSLGSYKDLLRAVTLHPVMGIFLNNTENEGSRPNENYARELMQLFSVGLVQLNQDGSVKRGANGAPIETYTQEDVVNATKALSGWSLVHEPNLPSSNWMNAGKTMVPKQWPQNAHDTTAKQVMGRSIPAEQSIQADLESLLDILVSHPNTAPFVSRRLIQSLVTSDPSPAYLERVAKVFQQTQGNLGQVVKAILLDAEARAADDPAKSTPRVGKMKEPLLQHINTLRGLGCKTAVMQWDRPLSAIRAWGQDPFHAPSVFGYTSPNHKAPESLIAAPEQKLVTTSEINRRLSALNWWEERQAQPYKEAGCDVQEFFTAAQTSDDALLNLINVRFFRGAMSPTLRNGALNVMKTNMDGNPPWQKASRTLQLLLTSPSYGVTR